MGFLKGQSRRVLKPWYTGGGPEQRFRRCFTNGLNQKLSSVGGESYIALSALRSSDFGFAHQKYFPTEILFGGAHLILRAPIITSLNTKTRFIMKFKENKFNIKYNISVSKICDASYYK